MYRLIIEDDEGKTWVVPLVRDEHSIGRKEGNTIRLTERNVSRRHARLVRQNGSIIIEDLSSYNGIKVNGDKINGRAAVNVGDRIQIGDYQLAVKVEKDEDTGDKTTPFIRDGAPMSTMDMQPTVQTPLVGGSGASSHIAEHARLVVVSSNFAGREFALDKATVVIGRTDDNDIVINHRSISRHHAKIVREGGHYQVVDLQSSNGVRVNGEVYGKIELRKGDLVDLGHVRLRFVAAGEDFVFERDAQVVDLSGGNAKTGLVVGGVVALALVGIGGWVLLRPGKPSVGVEPGSVVAAKPSTPAPASAEVEGQVAKLLLDADKAIKTEDWDAALTKADAALKLDPTQELARDKKTKAATEAKNKKAYTGFVDAAGKSDLDSAIASYNEISSDSIYRGKAMDKIVEVRRSYVRNHLDQAKKSKSANRCDEARQHVEAVLTVEEGNSEASDIIRSCGAASVASKPLAVAEPKPAKPSAKPEKVEKPEKPEKPVAVAPPPETPKPKPDPAQDDAQAEKILQEAQDFYVHGQYQQAIDTAKKAMKAQPIKAWRTIGASSCFLKDKAMAVQAWNKIDTNGRNLLRYVCSRNEIQVP